MEINKFLSQPHNTFSIPLVDEEGQFSWVPLEGTWAEANLKDRVDRTVTFLLEEMEEAPKLERLHLLDSFAIRFCLFCPQDPEACYAYKKTIWAISEKCSALYEIVSEKLKKELWKEIAMREKEAARKKRAEQLQKEMDSVKRMGDEEGIELLQKEQAQPEEEWYHEEFIVPVAVSREISERVQKAISAEKETVDTVFNSLADPKKDRKNSVELLREYYDLAYEERGYMHKEIIPDLLKSPDPVPAPPPQQKVVYC